MISSIDLNKFHIPSQVIEIINNWVNNFLGVISEFAKNTLGGVLQAITSIPKMIICIVITILSTYFICVDKIYILDKIEYHFPRKWIKKLSKNIKKIISSFGNYLKAESILILISFIEILIGLYIFKILNFGIEYPFLVAVGIAFIDALPILGAGTVMLPWAIISGINGNLKLAIGLVILYIIIVIVKQIVEPKILSSNLGIHPIFTLISMYTGFKIFGIIGLFIGPVVLIVLKNVFENLIEEGIVKSLLYKR